MTYFCCHERLQYFHIQYLFGRSTSTDLFHPQKLCIFVFIISFFLSGHSVKKKHWVKGQTNGAFRWRNTDKKDNSHDQSSFPGFTDPCVLYQVMVPPQNPPCHQFHLSSGCDQFNQRQKVLFWPFSKAWQAKIIQYCTRKSREKNQYNFIYQKLVFCRFLFLSITLQPFRFIQWPLVWVPTPRQGTTGVCCQW